MTTELKHEDIRWRVSNTWDKGDKKMGMLVGYIDSRTAMEALDVLDPNWSSKMEPITLAGESGIRCTLIVNGVAREDVGVASNTEPLKGAFSDALKRAAVHFGIGRELYELPKIAVECEVVNGKTKGPRALPTFKDGRWEIDRQWGWVKYEREPTEQPQRGERASDTRRADSRPATTPAAVKPSLYRRDELARLMAEYGLDTATIEVYATTAGIPRDERPMSDESMDTLIDTILESVRIEPAGERVPSDSPPPKTKVAA